MKTDDIQTLLAAELAHIPNLPCEHQSDLRDAYRHRRERYPARPRGRVLEDAIAAVEQSCSDRPVLFFDAEFFATRLRTTYHLDGNGAASLA